jgi:S1-C subfamily serine protease
MIGGGLGMAVPSEAVELLLAKAVANPDAGEPGYLGVAGQLLPEGIAASLPGSAPPGAWLLTVIESGGPAEAAGLWPGDILLDLDGVPPGEEPSRRLRSGRPARARLLRGGVLREIDIVPGTITA